MLKSYESEFMLDLILTHLINSKNVFIEIQHYLIINIILGFFIFTYK